MSKIKDFLNVLFKQPKLYLPLSAGLFLNGLIWFLIIWRLPASATWIPLHYSSYFGIDWIGPWINIIYYPVISFLIIVINTAIGSLINEKYPNLTVWLFWTNLIVQLIILTSLIFLIINYFS